MSSNYRQYLLTLAPFSDAELDQIIARTELRSILAGEVLFQAGEVCTHVYGVKTGCLRLYTQDAAGKELNIFFAFENESITDKISFVQKKPSIFSIDAIEDTEVISLDEEAISYLHEHMPHITKVAQCSDDQRFRSTQEHLLQLLTKTVEERIQYFREHDPNIFERIPIEMIASFLGIELWELRRLLQKAMEVSEE